MSITLGKGVSLPLEAVTETFAIIANRGAGKSSTGRVLVEELHGAGQPVIVLDPKGDWHGLRSSRDGKKAGLPFVIIGGDHGDLPLHHDAGDLVARTLVEARASAVIDMSLLSKTRARSFATAFAERLYRANREPLHLVVDEGDILIPQRAAAETMRLLGAMEDLAKRGRHRGIGMTVITQRAADVSKSVLDLMETLIVLRVTGPKTRKAVMDWVDDHTDDPEQMNQLLGSLKTLPVGQGWIWSPGWLGDLQRVQVRPIATLDTHATPRPGVKTVTATRRAAVDIDALRTHMDQLAQPPAAAGVAGESSLVKDLRRQIKDLQRQADRPPQQVRVEIPVVRAAGLEALERLERDLNGLQTTIAQLRTELTDLPDPPTATPPTPAPPTDASTDPRPSTPARSAATPDPDDASLGKAHKAIMTVLATYGPRDVGTTAILAGYSASGGGYRNALGRLRSLGYVDGRDQLELTDLGREHLGDIDPLPAGDQLRAHWQRQKSVPAAGRRILDALADAHPHALSVDELAERTGYAASGGGYRNALGRLRSLGLITGRGDLHISADLVG